MVTRGNALSGIASITQAVVDPYSLYSITLKHSAGTFMLTAGVMPVPPPAPVCRPLSPQVKLTVVT
jgi:hypothetical protein